MPSLENLKQSTKTWLLALVVFLAYVVVAVLAVWLLHVRGARMWWIIGGLTVLGLLSAMLLLWFLRDTLRHVSPASPAGSIDAILAAARAQLAKSKKGVAHPEIGALPVLVVVGPTGATKTTTIVRSGLDPELLAGDVFRGETVAQTETINMWFAQGTLVVEGGGPLLGDIDSWHRLLRALRPRSLRSALTGRAQAPRLALVCVGCDEFYKPGSGETMPALARDIRSRLGEAARQFGVQLPTYVVFTKLDAIPHFDAYTRNLSADEAREPLGAAVVPDSGGAGTYADRVTPKLEHAFDELTSSLAERRLIALAREHAAEFKPGAYEFPREFNKLRALAVDFVREIGRPSELQVSPVLRGFYFTGVQAVYVTEAAQEYTAPAQQQAEAERVRNATAVLGAGGRPVAAAGAQTAPSGGTRKVPRWDFLPRMIREVVFGDAAAIRLTSAGARVGFWRKLGLAAVIVISLGLTTAFAISYGGNSDLAATTLDATRGIAKLAPNPVDLPPQDALARLDVLRRQVDTLSAYEHDGAPLHLRWGLYSGSRLYPSVRAAYFAAFSKLMFAETRTAMFTKLRALPDAPTPTDDYGDTYSLLKVYLITTANPDKSTVDFLAPALMTRWLNGRSVDSARATLARRQFETYANELHYANPFPDTADARTVERARTFLRQFAKSEPIYQGMLAEASKTNASVQFNRAVAGSASYIVDTYEVPGAFTKGGSDFMLKAFKTVDKYLSGERWVVGDDAAGVDKTKLVGDLQARYADEYATHWRKYLSSAQVRRYDGVKDAAAKLAVLSSNQSTLLALFSIASTNTAVAVGDLSKTFQPVQLVTPPNVTDKLISDKNGPYMNALLQLQTSLDQTSKAQGGAAEQAAGQALTNASAARTAARQIAAGFTIDQQGQVSTVVQNLMEAPITYAEQLLKNFGADEVNARGRQFCSQVRGTLAKYPFNPDAATQASLAEVAALIRPNTGTLWKFYNDALASAVPKQGNQYVAKPDAGTKVSDRFVSFLNRASAFGDAMFKDDTPEPHISFQVQPQPGEFQSVSITLDGAPIRSTVGGNLEMARIDWPGAQHEARLSAGQSAAQERTIVGPYTGPWAVFQLFNAADEWRTTGNTVNVAWELAARRGTAASTAAKIVVQLVAAGPEATVLRKGALAGADVCSSDIAR